MHVPLVSHIHHIRLLWAMLHMQRHLADGTEGCQFLDAYRVLKQIFIVLTIVHGPLADQLLLFFAYLFARTSSWLAILLRFRWFYLIIGSALGIHFLVILVLFVNGVSICKTGKGNRE